MDAGTYKGKHSGVMAYRPNHNDVRVNRTVAANKLLPKAEVDNGGNIHIGTGVSATNSCGLTWVYGVPEDIDSLVPLEIPDGQVLRNRSVRAFAIGT
jgi:hypothetical protein